MIEMRLSDVNLWSFYYGAGCILVILLAPKWKGPLFPSWQSPGKRKTKVSVDRYSYAGNRKNTHVWTFERTPLATYQTCQCLVYSFVHV